MDEYFITNKHTMSNGYSVAAPSRGSSAITGIIAQLMLEGGYKSYCKCYGYTTDGYRLRGVSCKHTAGVIVRAMKLRGWPLEYCKEVACDTDTFPGLLYFRSDFEGISSEELFTKFWEGSTRNTKKTTTSRRSFQFRYKIWNRILDFLKSNPGSGVRELKRAMGVWEGVIERYLKEGISRGYINKITGRRGQKAQLFCVEEPEAPVVTQPCRHTTTIQNKLWTLVNKTVGCQSLEHEARKDAVKSGELLNYLVEIYGYADSKIRDLLPYGDRFELEVADDYSWLRASRELIL